MTVEYFIQRDPQYAHEELAVVKLAQLMQRAFAASSRFYLLAANVCFWRTQADALVLTPHAIILLEFKSCSDPVYGRAHGCWHVISGQGKIRGGSHDNPYQQILANRAKLIKYLDRNRQRFLNSGRARQAAGQWGQISGAIIFHPHLHPDSDIVTPPDSRAWLGVIGLNETAEFLFSRFSPQFDFRPQELRQLAVEALHCRPWDDVTTLLPPLPGNGYLWLLDESEQHTYGFPITDKTTIGRSRDNTLVVPRRYSHTSRYHAFVQLAGTEPWLYDNSSTHGTFVNGQAVNLEKGHALKHGDRVTLGAPDAVGACQLCFESQLRQDASTEPTAATRL